MTPDSPPTVEADAALAPAKVTTTPDRATAAGIDSSVERTARTVFRCVAVLAIAPIVITAIRAAIDGWIPTNDAAATVIRAKYALGTHPALVGLYAWPTSQLLHTTTYTLGPWQLWWLSMPTRVLGVTWGPLLAMATLNTIYLLVGAWIVRRRLGYRVATFVMLGIALLIWGLGPTTFTSPVPVVATAAPFAAYCLTAWVVALGDRRALPFAALFAGLLILGHPESLILVVVIGLGALGAFVISRRSADEHDPADHSLRRPLIVCALITLVLWTPPLIQQFAHRPGNFSNIVRGSFGHPAGLPTGLGLKSGIALFAGPPFWLRGSTDHSFLTGTAAPPSTIEFAATVAILAILLAGVGFIAHRRRDREASTSIAMAAIALVAMWIHGLKAPPGAYFLPFWVVAMFISLCIGFAVLRSIPTHVRDTLRRTMPIGALGFAVALLALNVPTAPPPHFTAGSRAQIRDSVKLNAAIVPQLRDVGTVTVAPAFHGTYPYAAALAVALDDAGVPMCARGIVSFLGYANPNCPNDGDPPSPGVTVTYQSAGYFIALRPGERLLARVNRLTPAEQAEYRNLSLLITDALEKVTANGRVLNPTPEYRRLRARGDLRSIIDSATSADREDGPASTDPLEHPAAITDTFEGRDTFALLIIKTSNLTGGKVAVTRVPGVSDAQLVRWAHLLSRLDQGVVVTARTHRGG